MTQWGQSRPCMTFRRSSGAYLGNHLLNCNDKWVIVLVD